MKKYLKLLLLVLLVATFSVKAETTYNVTINNGICSEDKVYNLYEVFTFNQTENRYRLNINWVDFFTTGAGKDFVTVDANRYITEIKTTADKEAIAKAAVEYLKTLGSITPAVNSKTNGKCENGTIQLEAADGYYLLISPKGNVGTLVEVKETAVVNEKNLYPEVESLLKTSGGEAAKLISTDIGKEFDVIIKAKLSRGVNNKLYLEDVPATGFVIDTSTIAVTGCTEKNYTLVTENFEQEGAAFGIEFDSTFLASINNDTTVVTITAKAKLTKDSLITINSEENANRVYYYYTDTTSPPASTAKAYSWYFYIKTRYLASENSYQNIVDAHYNVSSDEEGKNLLKFVKLEDGKYRLATNEDEEKDVTTDLVRVIKDAEKPSEIIITGLDVGKYYVIQTSVPYGFNKYTGDPKELTISAAPDSDGVNLVYQAATATIDVTQSSFSLPSTGSRGKLILTSIGALLVTISLSSIIIKSRKNN